MIQALAPKKPRGCSWVWLAIVAVVWTPTYLQAQTPPAGAGDQTPRGDDAKPAAKDDPADDEPTAEVFMDPNAKKALLVFNPLTFTGQAIKTSGSLNDLSKIQNMTIRATNIDPDFLKRYVEFFAVELTKRDNLNALINPDPKMKPIDPPARALQKAVDALTKPIFDARASENKEFLTVYTKTLFESSLPKILENNYLTRIDAMIVLGMSGGSTSSALDLYINQIKKPDQIIWVKLWAARGLTNAAQNGSVDLDAAKANQAAEALVNLLDDDPKLPWPVQMRALEALGSLRVAAATLPKGKIDAASVAMRFLVDTEAKPAVRAWAAWALGMMRVPPGVSPYNFNLVGHEIGEFAVDLGDQIVKEFDGAANFEVEKDLSSHLTGLLLFQVYPALVGEEGVRDSGLIHSTHLNAGPAKGFLAKIDEKVKAVSLEAYELLRAGGVAGKAKRNDLDAKLADLKAFLGQSSPKDRHLTPGGPEFQPNAEQVAGAARP